MIVCPSIMPASFPEACRTLRALRHPHQIVELRIDQIARIDFAELLDGARAEVIITNRRTSEGGMFRGTAHRQWKILSGALDSGAEYVDVELSWGRNFVRRFVEMYGPERVICSYHDTRRTPPDLSVIYKQCRSTGAGTLKIATTANSVSDNNALFEVLKRARVDRQPMIGICMGERGTLSRILGGKFGSWLTFGSPGESQHTAPGQLTVSEMNAIFRAGRITSRTRIFGLVGNPVRHSRGIYFHNAQFRHQSCDAVYLNFLADDIRDFWTHFHGLITGLSITMPFKQDIIPLLDRVDPEIASLRSVNTVIKKRARFIGYNTDYLALVEILKKRGSLKNKEVVILGTGGIARAMSAAALRLGAEVTILSRTISKARDLAEQFSCRWGTLEDVQQYPCDILMNATPVGMDGTKSVRQSPVPSSALRKISTVLDAVYNPEITPLLWKARANGCRIIKGTELFQRQAHLQSRMFIGALS